MEQERDKFASEEVLRHAEGYLTAYRATGEYVSAMKFRIEQYAVMTGRDTATSTLKQIENIQRMQENRRNAVNRLRLTRQVLARMERNEAKMLVLCYVRGFSYGSIEQMFKFSERTFYRKRKAALEKFAGLLGEEETRWVD